MGSLNLHGPPKQGGQDLQSRAEPGKGSQDSATLRRPQGSWAMLLLHGSQSDLSTHISVCIQPAPGPCSQPQGLVGRSSHSDSHVSTRGTASDLPARRMDFPCSRGNPDQTSLNPGMKVDRQAPTQELTSTPRTTRDCGSAETWLRCSMGREGVEGHEQEGQRNLDEGCTW